MGSVGENICSPSSHTGHTGHTGHTPNSQLPIPHSSLLTPFTAKKKRTNVALARCVASF
ncbi:MAG: hypothetical protein RMY29_004345 [Nostoc sp. CreGUA01]|nr:hypothetical protein [Nostoc sp. CreGUA01]